MVQVIVQHHVADYDRWLPVYIEHGACGVGTAARATRSPVSSPTRTRSSSSTSSPRSTELARSHPIPHSPRHGAGRWSIASRRSGSSNSRRRARTSPSRRKRRVPPGRATGPTARNPHSVPPRQAHSSVVRGHNVPAVRTKRVSEQDFRMPHDHAPAPHRA